MSTASSPGVFVHPAGLNEATEVGSGTRIWAFAHVLPGARIGTDCNICDHVFIENDVRIGDRVTVKCGVQLWDGITIEDDVFIGPNVTFANDPFPRSRQRPEKYTPTVVRYGASIGANVTVLPGVTIGQQAMVGAGSVVTRDVPPHAVVYGNPARIRSYSRQSKRLQAPAEASSKSPSGRDDNASSCSIPGVQQVALPQITDLRGNLSFAELGKGLPFLPKRYFVVYGVPSPEVRGEHAHRTLHQFLVVLHGQCRVAFDDGTHRWETLLDSPQKAVHVSPMVWNNLFGFTADCVLLVLASDTYDEADYIRNYDDFIATTSLYQ